MDQIPLSNCLLSQCHNAELVILTHRWIEVELALQVLLIHHLIVVFMADFLVQHPIATVLLRVLAHLSRKLGLDLGKVLNQMLFVLCLSISTNLSTLGILA